MRKLPNVEAIREALARVRRWRCEPDAGAACPLCEAPGLVVMDRSARPHAEWYAVKCPACGLDDVINVPLGPNLGGGS